MLCDQELLFSWLLSSHNTFSSALRLFHCGLAYGLVHFHTLVWYPSGGFAGVGPLFSFITFCIYGHWKQRHRPGCLGCNRGKRGRTWIGPKFLLERIWWYQYGGGLGWFFLLFFSFFSSVFFCLFLIFHFSVQFFFSGTSRLHCILLFLYWCNIVCFILLFVLATCVPFNHLPSHPCPRGPCFDSCIKSYIQHYIFSSLYLVNDLPA